MTQQQAGDLMSETKWATSGWSVVANSWQYTTIYAADGTPICRLDLEDWGVTEDNQSALETEQAKCAHLIAAAPDLAKALAECEAYFDDRADVDNGVGNSAMYMLTVVRDALARALGETS
jgi:hypothetical protein